METLSKLLNKAYVVGLLQRFHVGNSQSYDCGFCIFFLPTVLYFFYRSGENDLGFLGCIRLLFEVIFGLKVNLSKSSLIAIGEVPSI